MLRQASRTPELDGIRGVAILLVLYWHYFVVPLAPPNLDGWPAMIYQARGMGWSGVDLFFVLSGFLIGGILIDNREAPNVFKVFYIRRALRIIPIYAIVLGVFYSCITFGGAYHSQFGWLFRGHLRLWPYLTMTQNFLPHHSIFLGPSWSLAIEEQFYLLLPALVIFLRPRALLKVSWVAVVISVVVRFFIPTSDQYMWTFGRLDGLFTGVLLAQAMRDPALLGWAARHIGAVKLAAWIMLAGTLEIGINAARFGCFAYTWLAMFFAAFMVIALVDHNGRVARLMRLRWLTWTGQIAYGLYLFHQPINGFFHGWAHGGPPQIHNLSQFALTGLAFVTLMIVASASYRFFELPLMNLGRRCGYSVARAGGGPAEPAPART